MYVEVGVKETENDDEFWIENQGAQTQPASTVRQHFISPSGKFYIETDSGDGKCDVGVLVMVGERWY